MVLFAAVTSIINLFEVPIEVFQMRFKLSRKSAATAVILISAAISLFIERGEVVGKWMDVVSDYMVPLGALLAGVMFFWVCRSEFVLEQINKGRKTAIGKWFIPLSKYVFIIGTLVVFLCGLLLGIN